MGDNYKEPKLTYAIDSSGKMVNIGSVERGLSCKCRCPKCNEPLVAKLGHDGGRQPHFAHRKDSNCHGSYMSALHKLAEQIIEEEKAVMAPAYKIIDEQKLEFESVEVEQRVERKDLQPDIVGVTSNGLRWFIEIRNTHEVDKAKRAKLIESNITCLEIDVREQTLENLKSFLLESAECREWINNPNYESQIEEIKRQREEEKIKEYTSNPQYKYCDSKCKYRLYHRKCIYQKRIISQRGLDCVICNEEKKRKDEAEWLSQNAPLLYVDSQKVIVRESDYIIDNNSKPYYEEPVSYPQSNIIDALPFDRLWTIDEYYQQLQSTSYYETENGQLAEIVKYDRITNKILLLYRDPCELRTYCSFHIVIINVSNGNLIRNKVADFTNQRAAMDSYYQRLMGMRQYDSMMLSDEKTDNELPF